MAKPLSSDAPLPPQRPPELRGATAPPQEQQQQQHTEQLPIANACTARLKALGYEISSATLASGSQSACHIDDPLSLHAIKASDGSMIRVVGDPILDCRMAESLGRWVDGVASPIIASAIGSPIHALRDVGGYECRNRNRRPDGKLSAHAQGLAIDIGGFETKSGTIIMIATQQNPAAAAIAALRQAACGWFLTVLGPGADPDHANHLHLDLQQHGSSDRYRICQ